MTAKRKNPNVGGVWITASTKDQLKVERALFKAWNAERLSKTANDRLEREWKPGSDAPAETRADAQAAADKYKGALKAAGRAVATFANRYGEDEARALGYLNPVHWTGNPSARSNGPDDPPEHTGRFTKCPRCGEHVEVYKSRITGAELYGRHMDERDTRLGWYEQCRLSYEPIAEAPKPKKRSRKNPCGGEFTPRSPLVHWSKDPEKRKRQRQHIRESIAARGNPEIVEPPEWLPTAIIPPSTFALLGECVEVEVKSTRGRAHRLIAPRANSCALLASADAQTLWLVWPSSTRHTRKPNGAEARATAKLYRKWSKFDPRVAIKMEASDRGPREKIGEVIAIRYRSDKWTGEPTLYEHKFTSHNVRAYADNKRAPRMIAIFDPNGRVLVTESGITG